MPKKLFKILIFASLIFFYYLYNGIFSNNINPKAKAYFIEIEVDDNFDELKKKLSKNELIINEYSLTWVAKLMKFDQIKLRRGRFKIEKNWSNRRLIQHLRSGEKMTLNLIINNKRTIEDLAGHIAKQLNFDSTKFVDNILLNEDSLAQLGYTYETIICLFIPNTYQVYYDISPTELIDRMKVENQKFWRNKSRTEKAKKINLSQNEVMTLASIVEKETNIKSERAKVAGVYINRLKRKIALQADPTVVFANRAFNIKRVLNKHLKFDSPYNTYMYSGLPPGPICIPSISSIDAVLNYEEHDYIFFCASPDKPGHVFAKTLAAHNANARRYRKWLNQQGIRR